MKTELCPHRRRKFPFGQGKCGISKRLDHLFPGEEAKISALRGAGILSVFLRGIAEIQPFTYFCRNLIDAFLRLFHLRFRSLFTDTDQNMSGMYLFRLGELGLACIIGCSDGFVADRGRFSHFLRIKQDIFQLHPRGQGIAGSSRLICCPDFRIGRSGDRAVVGDREQNIVHTPLLPLIHIPQTGFLRRSPGSGSQQLLQLFREQVFPESGFKLRRSQTGSLEYTKILILVESAVLIKKVRHLLHGKTQLIRADLKTNAPGFRFQQFLHHQLLEYLLFKLKPLEEFRCQIGIACPQVLLH